MLRDIMLVLLGAGLSGILSWLFTHIYHRKSSRQQESAAASQIASLTEALAAQNESDVALLQQQRIEASVSEYKHAGTPVGLIDTYTDLSNEQKAELLDTVMRRIKGRPAKRNKYRGG